MLAEVLRLAHERFCELENEVHRPVVADAHFKGTWRVVGLVHLTQNESGNVVRNMTAVSIPLAINELLHLREEQHGSGPCLQLAAVEAPPPRLELLQHVELVDRIVHLPDRRKRSSYEIHQAIVPTHFVEVLVGRHMETSDLKFQVLVEDDQANKLYHHIRLRSGQDAAKRLHSYERSGHSAIIVGSQPGTKRGLFDSRRDSWPSAHRESRSASRSRTSTLRTPRDSTTRRLTSSIGRSIREAGCSCLSSTPLSWRSSCT